MQRSPFSHSPQRVYSHLCRNWNSTGRNMETLVTEPMVEDSDTSSSYQLAETIVCPTLDTKSTNQQSPIQQKFYSSQRSPKRNILSRTKTLQTIKAPIIQSPSIYYSNPSFSGEHFEAQRVKQDEQNQRVKYSRAKGLVMRNWIRDELQNMNRFLEKRRMTFLTNENKAQSTNHEILKSYISKSKTQFLKGMEENLKELRELNKYMAKSRKETLKLPIANTNYKSAMSEKKVQSRGYFGSLIISQLRGDNKPMKRVATLQSEHSQAIRSSLQLLDARLKSKPTVGTQN